MMPSFLLHLLWNAGKNGRLLQFENSWKPRMTLEIIVWSVADRDRIYKGLMLLTFGNIIQTITLCMQRSTNIS
jgi:hypothetical protein